MTFSIVPHVSKALLILSMRSFCVDSILYVKSILLTFYEKFLSVGEHEIFHSPGLIVQMNRVLLIRQVVESEVFRLHVQHLLNVLTHLYIAHKRGGGLVDC